MEMKRTSLLLVLGLALAAAGQECALPFIAVGSKCLYLETDTPLSWPEARDYCKTLAGDTGTADIASFPSCDDFVAFSRHAALNGPNISGVWVGGHTAFSPNMWQWVNGDDLQTGVPFWYYNEDYDGTRHCAASYMDYYNRLVDAHCEHPLSFVCEMSHAAEKAEKSVSKTQRDMECENHGVVVGDFCYVFYDKPETWDDAEKKCRSQHDDVGGELYYPSSCNEFTHMAHHLEASENTNSYWVGGVDVSGKDEWTWVSGENIPGGPPYWATGEPSHSHENQPHEHCTVMAADKRYYLHDTHCTDKHPYICKLMFV
ncbi:macrophage mannose receptor 1-like [Penaeus japonicus]|uniref:macrophage mannose receptor 1-like n=1 Tax=Penaeus japonicus TaxID=27405 RepID=UPI001C70CB78|nr:macrophage mannose receptor 1-like [Penaeus japonicus]